MPRSTNEKMSTLLDRSIELNVSLSKILNQDVNQSSSKEVVSKSLCLVSREHSTSITILVSNRRGISSLCLLRSQYEALVRMLWVYYVASDNVIEKLAAELTENSVRQSSNKMKMLSEMLTELEGKAPKEAMTLLLEFKDYSWKPLSSFVHSGMHASQRKMIGMPMELVANAVKQSNALLLMAAMMMVIISQSQKYVGRLPKYQKVFADCLPPLHTET
ncbi:MAG: DUF6988 family protein [Bacteroidota bacterium]